MPPQRRPSTPPAPRQGTQASPHSSEAILGTAPISIETEMGLPANEHIPGRPLGNCARPPCTILGFDQNSAIRFEFRCWAGHVNAERQYLRSRPDLHPRPAPQTCTPMRIGIFPGPCNERCTKRRSRQAATVRHVEGLTSVVTDDGSRAAGEPDAAVPVEVQLSVAGWNFLHVQAILVGVLSTASPRMSVQHRPPR